MLLMEKIAAIYPQKIGFLKQLGAQTKTLPQPSIRAFGRQRIRWASKSTSYKGWQVKSILLMVWLFCLSMLFDLIAAFWFPTLFYLFLFKFTTKAIVDFRFLYTMTVFFKRRDLLIAFIPSLFYHWTYIVVIGLLGNTFKEYQWKGRRTN